MKKLLTLTLSFLFLTQASELNAIILINDDAHHISCKIKGVLKDNSVVFESKDISINIDKTKSIGIRHEVENLLRKVKDENTSGEVFVLTNSPGVEDSKKVIFKVTPSTTYEEIMNLEGKSFRIPH